MGSEILLEDLTRVIDKECHDTGVSILSRIGNECKAANHLAAYHIVQSAAGRGRSLFRQDLVIVTVERRPATANTIALAGCLSDEFAERACFAAFCGRPVESVFLACLADDALCINSNTSAGGILFGVIILRVDIREAGLD